MMKNNIVSNDYKIASTEVLAILNYLPKSKVEKIPNGLKEFLKENSVLGYNPQFDFYLGLDKIELRKKTKLLLAMIYRNYICTEEERAEYDEILKRNEEIYQKKLKEKYDSNEIFGKARMQEKSNVNLNENTNNTALIQNKKSFFERIKDYILKMLHIKK